MKSILFVCTGNIFRSVSAEYALKTTLNGNSEYMVSSAGTVAHPQPMHPIIRDRLAERGIDPSKHRQRKLTEALLGPADLVVAMGLDHREHIASRFERQAILFKQVCCQKEEPVLDIHEAIPEWETNQKASEEYVVSVVEYIWKAMPAFVENLPRYLA